MLSHPPGLSLTKKETKAQRSRALPKATQQSSVKGGTSTKPPEALRLLSAPFRQPEAALAT